MRKVFLNFADVGQGTDKDDHVLIRSAKTRLSTSNPAGLTTTAPLIIRLDNGKATVELDEGWFEIAIRARNMTDSDWTRLYLPPAKPGDPETVSLSWLFAQAKDYADHAQPVSSEALKQLTALVQRAEGAQFILDDGIQAAIRDAVSGMEATKLENQELLDELAKRTTEQFEFSEETKQEIAKARELIDSIDGRLKDLDELEELASNRIVNFNVQLDTAEEKAAYLEKQTQVVEDYLDELSKGKEANQETLDELSLHLAKGRELYSSVYSYAGESAESSREAWEAAREVERKFAELKDIAQSAANGTNRNFHGPTEPVPVLENDTWFKQEEDGSISIWIAVTGEDGQLVWQEAVPAIDWSEANRTLEEAKASLEELDTVLATNQQTIADLRAELDKKLDDETVRQALAEANQSNASAMQELDAKLGNLDTTMKNLDSSLGQIESGIDTKLGQLALSVEGDISTAKQELEKQIGEHNKTLNTLSDQLGEKDKQLSTLAEDLSAAQGEVEALDLKFGDQQKELNALALETGMLQPGNLVWNPLAKENMSGWLFNNRLKGTYYATGGQTAERVRVQWTTTQAQTNIDFGHPDTKRFFPIQPNQEFLASVWVRPTVELPAGAMRLDFFGASAVPSPVLPANTWTKIEGVIKVNSNNTAKRSWLRLAHTTAIPADAEWDICNPTVVEMAGDLLIVDGAISAKKVAAGAIETAHLTAGAVTAQKIDANAVTAEKVAANAIKAVNIEAGAVIAGKLGADAVSANNIAAGQVTAGKLGADAVTAKNIAAGAVIAGKLGADAVTANNIQAGAVSSREIAANSVNATHIVIAQPGNLIANGDLTQGIVGWDSSKLTLHTPTQANPPNGRYLNLTDRTTQAFQAHGTDNWFNVVPGASYAFEIWLYSNKDNSRFYLEMVNQNNSRAGETGSVVNKDDKPVVERGVKPGNTHIVNGVDLKAGWFRYSTVYTMNATTTRARLKNFWFNHSEGAVKDAQICFGGVSLRPMADASLIVDGSVTAKAIAAGTITSTEIASGTITAAEIASGTIKAGNIKAGELTSDNVTIKNGAIKTAMIGDGQITTAKIGDAQITNAKIGNIDAGKISTGYLNAARINVNSLSGDRIVTNTLAAAKIVNESIQTGQIKAGGVHANRLVANSITANQIAADTITGKEIAANSIYASRLTVAPGNLFPDPHFQDDCWGTSGQVRKGTANGGELQLHANGTQQGRYYQPAGGTADGSMMLEPGASYRLTMGCYASSTANQKICAIYLRYRNTSNTVKAYFAGNVTDIGQHGQRQLMFTTPTDMRDGACTIGFFIQSGMTAGNINIWDVQLTRAADGKLIVDGAIETKHMTANTIDASVIKSGTLSASKITSGTLDASKVNVTNLNANNIKSGTLDASKVNVTNLNANNIKSGTLDASKVNVTNLNANNIKSGSIHGSMITAGTIDAAKVNANEIFLTKTGEESLNDQWEEMQALISSQQEDIQALLAQVTTLKSQRMFIASSSEAMVNSSGGFSDPAGYFAPASRSNIEYNIRAVGDWQGEAHITVVPVDITDRSVSGTFYRSYKIDANSRTIAPKAVSSKVQTIYSFQLIYFVYPVTPLPKLTLTNSSNFQLTQSTWQQPTGYSYTVPAKGTSAAVTAKMTFLNVNKGSTYGVRILLDGVVQKSWTSSRFGPDTVFGKSTWTKTLPASFDVKPGQRITVEAYGSNSTASKRLVSSASLAELIIYRTD